MNETLLKTALTGAVGHGSQAHKALLEQVNLEGLKAGDQHVQTQIVFVPPNQVGLVQVLADDVAALLAHVLFLANHADAPTATARCRLKDVHILEVGHLAVDLPALVVLRENVGVGRNVKLLAIEATHPLHVAPHEVLAPDAPRARKVVGSLVLVHMLDSVRLE